MTRLLPEEVHSQLSGCDGMGSIEVVKDVKLRGAVHQTAEIMSASWTTCACMHAYSQRLLHHVRSMNSTY